MDRGKYPIKIDLVDIYDRLFSAFGPQHWWPAESRFEMIVGAILTQNTAWKNVEKALLSLKSNTVLNPVALRKIPQSELAVLIRSSGFFNVKALRLKAFIAFLFDEYDGSLDKMFSESGDRLREKLLAIKGLGKETVDSILLYAGQYPYFVVDAYTRRIFSRHNLLDPKSPYQIVQHFFMEHLPVDVRLYNEYHALIVKLAKQFCKKEPECIKCPLNYLFEEATQRNPTVTSR
jgi:endonuclease-3 related protein